MHYEINVSLNGQHFFATHERSLMTYDSAQRVYKTLCSKFPVKEGYSVRMTKWESVGKTVAEQV